MVIGRIGLLPGPEIVGLVHPIQTCTMLVFPRMNGEDFTVPAIFTPLDISIVMVL